MAQIISFDSNIAAKIGVDEAIILRYIDFWIRQNSKKDRNYVDDTYWMYLSMDGFQQTFFFWTKAQIRRILLSLREKEIIQAKQLSRNKYIRTNWYALTAKGKSLLTTDSDHPSDTNSPSNCQEAPNDVPDITNEGVKNAKTIEIKKAVEKPIADNNNIALVERKGIIQLIIDYLNQKTGAHYRCTNTKTKGHINARLKEGYTLDDFKKVIDTKVSEWISNPKMAKYLRPETLFGPKFENYLNQPTFPKEDAQSNFNDFIQKVAMARGEI